MRWAMGWLGWSFDEAWHTDINAILVAMEGRGEMLATIFGNGPVETDDRPVGDKLKAFAKRHNTNWAREQRRGK